MTADTETIREALHALARYIECGDHDEGFREDCESCVALAALGRVEEREAKLIDALRFYAEEAIWDEHGAAFRFGDGLPDRGRVARAALAGSVAGEQDQDLGRASAASTSRERLTEGRAEE